MGVINFDKLYDNYNILSEAKEKISEHSQEYEEAIEGTKGNEKEKKLAAQIISQFFKHFPSLQIQAIEALFDICEDDQASIRIVGIKTLPALCKENKEYVGKIADILAQLLQLEDPHEYNVASCSLLQVLQEDHMQVVKSILRQVSESDGIIREKCIKFLVSKVKAHGAKLEVQELIATEFKKIVPFVSGEEFYNIMKYLTNHRSSNTPGAQEEIVNMCVEQMELDQDFEVLDKDSNNNIDKLITCIKFSMKCFSSNLESTKFVKYICDQVLPHWNEIGNLTDGERYQLAIVRQLAQLTTYCGKLENPSFSVVQIYDKLKLHMPPPPEDTTSLTLPYLDFSRIEALLYAFHKIARQCPDFLTHDQQELKDFRARLMYLSRGVQGCKNAMKAKTDKKDLLSDEEKKIKEVTPPMLDNINTIIKDLFYQPPMYKSNVTLSYTVPATSPEKKSAETTSQKRHVPITFDNKNGSTAKQVRTNRFGENVKLYTPPSGKFSNNFQRGNRFGGRGGGGRGGARGRGSGRGWRN